MLWYIKFRVWWSNCSICCLRWCMLSDVSKLVECLAWMWKGSQRHLHFLLKNVYIEISMTFGHQHWVKKMSGLDISTCEARKCFCMYLLITLEPIFSGIILITNIIITQITKFMGSTWVPPGSHLGPDGTHVGPMNLVIREATVM